jgi:hypothetical protein
MKQCLRRLLTVGVAFAAALLMLTAAAFATSGAHFFNVSSSVNDNGALVVSYDEAGVGNATVTYTIHIDNASAVYACINGGGKHPQAANKESFEGQVSGGGSFEPKNGRVVADLTAGPLLAPQFTCPSGQRRVLAAVTYTNIVLTDTTNGVSTSVADASRVFFDV